NSDGRRAYDVEPTMDLLARVRRTYGAELVEHLVPVEARDGDLLLTGLVGSPRISRRDTSRQVWLLNGRFLRDKVLVRVLKEAYRGFLEEGRQPVAFLRLAMDPAAVDVNVHPAKSEVRFRDQRRMFGFLVEALREAIRRTDMATPGEAMLAGRARRLAREEDPRQARLPDPGQGVVREVPGRAYAPGVGIGSAPPSFPSGPPATGGAVGSTQGGGLGAPLAGPGAAGAPAGAAPSPDPWAPTDSLRGPYLQVAKTFIMREVADGFEIIDQHALHERLTYELLLREVQGGTVEVQRLLVPEVVEVSRADLARLEEHAGELGKLGIELAVFGETAVAVSGLPVRLRNPDPEGLVRDLVEVIARTGKPPTAADVLEEVLHRCACRSSVMAGDTLSQEEIQALLERAAALESDQTCPHARPTRVRFTVSDLERAFHRR
ncbi:MAG: hypothetical protein ISQ08_06445, partial [Planctomycetes bacterium]|nr:hypothetical protein [Planctomycetota bacterium]